MSKTIWTNHGFRPEALEVFKQGLAAAGHRLIHSPKSSASVLAAGASDPSMNEADIAFGQPDVGDVVRLTRLRWVAHLDVSEADVQTTLDCVARFTLPG